MMDPSAEIPLVQKSSHRNEDVEEKFDDETNVMNFSLSRYVDVDCAVGIEFKNLTVTLKPTKKWCRISPGAVLLHDSSGSIPAGKLTAIMGPSGAGKTTLCEVLSQRYLWSDRFSSVSVIGSIEYHRREQLKDENRPLSREDDATLAFCAQEDLFLDTDRVSEALETASMLRNQRKSPAAKRTRRIQKLLQFLNLRHTEKSFPKTLSGGERRRVSLALQLVNDPGLIICDEPVSGLDAKTAYDVVRILKQLTRDGTTVAMIVHQASSEMLTLFDHLLVLSMDRRIVYSDSIDGLVDFVEKSRGKPLNPHTNPADALMTSLLEPKIKWPADDENRYKNNIGYHSGSISSTNITRWKKTSFCIRLTALLNRGARQNKRSLFTTYIRIFQCFVVAGLCGALYWKEPYDTELAIRNRQSFHFLVVMALVLGSILSLILVFQVELALLKREIGDGMYRSHEWLLAKSLWDIPVAILCAVIITGLLSATVGFNGNFVVVTLIYVFIQLTASSLALVIGIIAPNAEAAVTLVTLVILPQLLFSGVFVPVENITVGIRWLEYVSIFKPATDVLVSLDLRDSTDIAKAYLETYNIGSTSREISWMLLHLYILFIGWRAVAYFELFWKAQGRDSIVTVWHIFGLLVSGITILLFYFVCEFM